MENLNFRLADKAISLDPSKSSFYKFTTDGVIEYVNAYFQEFTGYEAHEIIGKNVNEFKHPEVPNIVFNMVLNHIKDNKNINLLLMDYTKDGQKYWYMSDFSIKTDAQGEILSIVSLRKHAPSNVIPKIESLYKKLADIEKHAGKKVAENYFNGFLEEKNMSLEEYTKSLILKIQSSNSPSQDTPTSKKRRGFFSRRKS